MSPHAERRRRAPWPLIAGVAAGILVLVAVLGAVVAITGAGLGGCTSSTATADTPLGSRAARDEIPPSRLALYRAAARRFAINWAFLAAIGAQECDHGACRGDNGYGCAGPMQIAIRRGSPCSPGGGPTLWERFKVDGNRDGRADVNSPADAIFTAARILRQAKGAPPTGGSYDEYRQAACRYYGACANPSAAYADEVMNRAVRYGFHAAGAPAHADAERPLAGAVASDGCVAAPEADRAGRFGPVLRARVPRRLAPLPDSITGGAPIQCDARIVADVVWLARRYRVRVSACYAIHSRDGEHPLGAATDLVPAAGDRWQLSTEALARAAGWKRSCAAHGVAPQCARPPFRFIAYNGYPGHGDPAHCRPCPGGAHLHLSWQTSASPGQAQNAPRTSYFAPTWIDVFAPGQEAADG